MRKVLLLLLAALSFTAANGEDTRRIVSVSPALTELVWHLGGGSAMVGRSNVCSYPEEVKKLPAAGNFAAPSLNRLLELKTQVLLADSLQDPKAVSALKSAGIEVVILPLRSLGEYRAAVAKVGEVLGRKEAADKEIARIEAVLEKYRSRNDSSPRRKAMFLVWDKPMMAAGGRSHLGEYIRLAGGENVGQPVDREFFRCAREWVMQSGVEVIFFPGGMAGEREMRFEGFEELPAVRDGRIFCDLDPDVFFRLGPRFDQALDKLARLLAQ